MTNDQDPEREFLQARSEALRMDLEAREAEYGKPITVESVTEIATEALGDLDRAGNPELANRFRAAFDCWRQTSGALEREIEQGAVAEGTRDAMNDALEEFERVVAEVNAWFDSQEEGGAR